MSDQEQENQEQENPEPATEEPGTEPSEPQGEPSEAETDDEPAEDEDLTEESDGQEPQEPAPKTDAEMSKVFKAIDRLRKDTATRVGNIFGDDALQLMDCPLCAAVAPGYLWPPDVAPLHEEQVTALRLLLNMPVATNYRQAEDFMPCPKCEGMGRVRTGSQVQNYEIAECPRCFAKGYVASPVSLPSNGNGHDPHEADPATGPTVYGHDVATTDPQTESVIQSLKDRGYMVVEPLSAPRPASV